MPLDYLLNLMGFLERRAPEFFLGELLLETIECLCGVEELPADAALSIRSPKQWMRQTPLFRALAAAAKRRVQDRDSIRQGAPRG